VVLAAPRQEGVLGAALRVGVDDGAERLVARLDRQVHVGQHDADLAPGRLVLRAVHPDAGHELERGVVHALVHVPAREGHVRGGLRHLLGLGALALALALARGLAVHALGRARLPLVEGDAVRHGGPREGGGGQMYSTENN